MRCGKDRLVVAGTGVRDTMADETAAKGPGVRWNVVEAIAWLVFAGGAFALTFNFDDPLPTYRLGPAFWPRMLIIGIAIAAIGLLFRPFMQLVRQQVEDAEPAREDAVDSRHEKAERTVTLETLAVLLVPIVYVYFIHQFGFYLVTPFFLAGYMYLLGVRNWFTMVVVTVGLYALIVLVFVKLIFTPLPPGAGIFYTLNGQFIGLLQ